MKIDMDNTLLPWLGRTMKCLDYFIMDQLQQKGIELTKVQFVLLKKLKEMDGQPQQNLAFLTNRDKASLARLLSTMEKKNLVARIPSKTDKRINHVHITKQGEEMLKTAFPIMQEVVDLMQDGIEEEDIKKVIEIMKIIRTNINADKIVAPLTNNQNI